MSRLREFYDEHLAFPLRWTLFATAVGTAIMFFTSWAGLRGRFWGDPISFMEAVALLPSQILIAFGVSFVVFFGLRARF
jgi:hypothetical protein